MKPLKIYVASSWRNLLQPGIVLALQRCGHKVYDFKNPIHDWQDQGLAPPQAGFAWSSIDPNWKNWTAAEYRQALQHPLAVKGYGLDIAALKACDACVLVLPSGRSASWEFGYAMGQGKRGIVVQFDEIEPELMYREAAIVTNMHELFDAFGLPGSGLEKGLSPVVHPLIGIVDYEYPDGKVAAHRPIRAEVAAFVEQVVRREADDGVYYVDTDSVIADVGLPVTPAPAALPFGDSGYSPPSPSDLVSARERRNREAWSAQHARILPVTAPVSARDEQKSEPNCRACASCYLDDMDFICGHKDAGLFGKKVNVAASTEGHCGPTLKKFVQHPLRTPDGGFIPPSGGISRDGQGH